MKWLSALLLPAIVAAQTPEVPRQQETAAITAYELRFDLEPKDFASEGELGRLRASGYVEVRNASAGDLSRMILRLYRLLRLVEARESGGRTVDFTQHVEAFGDWPTMQANFVELRLARPLRPGASLRVHLAYEGYLAGYEETGMRYVKDRVDTAFTFLRPECLVFPEIGGPASWRGPRHPFTYRIEIHAPTPMVAASGGPQDPPEPVAGGTVTHFRSEVPVDLMFFAVAPYRVVKDQDLLVCHFEQDAPAASMILAKVKEAMALLRAKWGPLPERAFRLIEIPDGHGSQATRDAIFQQAGAFRDADRLPELYHELSHRWDLRPLDAAPCRAESEGLATYIQYLLNTKLNPKAPPLDARAETLLERLRSHYQKHPEDGTVPMVRFGETGLTDLAYPQGGLVFCFLHELLGEERLDASLRGLRSRHPDGITSADFFRALAEEGGAPVARMLQDWFFGTGGVGPLASGRTFHAWIADYLRPSPLATTSSASGAAAPLASAIRFDAEAVERLIRWANSGASDLPVNWSSTRAFALTREWAAGNALPDPDSEVERILREIAAEKTTDPRKPRMVKARRFLDEIMRRKDAFLGAALPHLSAYLPPGTPIRADVLFAAFIPAYTFSWDDGIVVNLTARFWDWNADKALNLLVHELFHVGFAAHQGSLDLASAHTPSELVDNVLWQLQNEGMATYVAYLVRPPGVKIEDYELLDSPAAVRARCELVRRLLDEAARQDGKDLGDFKKRIWSEGVGEGQRAFYVVGAAMARRIEEKSGRPALIATIRGGPRAFAAAYEATSPPEELRLGPVAAAADDRGSPAE